MPVCNTTLEDETISEQPLVGHMTFHTLFLIVAAAFSLFAICLSEFLIFQHARRYSRPWEQKHIIRILFMIPVYALVSFLSFYYYRHTIYYQVLRDCYEAIALSSFFTLLCSYIAPDIHSQKEYFRLLTPKNWILPLNWFQRWSGGTESGWLRIPRSGLTWFNIMFVCVYQYCFIRVFFTVVAVITQVNGRYCESSINPAFAHVWVMVFEAASVTVAMYGLIQFYYQLRHEIAQHKPFLKILCIKLVIFFSFWQTLLISFLTSTGVIKSSDKINPPDITVGIPAVCLCVEMAIFSVMHLFAFPSKPYTHTDLSVPGAYHGETFSEGKPEYKGGFLGIKAIIDAFNPWDIVKAVGRSFRWLFVGRKRRFEDPSYKNNAAGASAEFDQPTAYKMQEPAFPLDSADSASPSHFASRPGDGTTSFSLPGTAARQKRYQPLPGGTDDDSQPLVHAQGQTGYAVPYSNSQTPHLGYLAPSPRPEAGDMGRMTPGRDQFSHARPFRDPSPYREDEQEWSRGDEDSLTRPAPLPTAAEGDLGGGGRQQYGRSPGRGEGGFI